MSKTYFSGPVNVLGATGGDNVLQIRSDADTVAVNLSRTEMAFLEGITTNTTEANFLDGVPHVNACVYAFDVVNLATNQGFVTVKHGSGLDLTEYVVPRAGSLTAISVAANASQGTGIAQFLATIDGTTKAALTVSLNTTNQTYAYSAVAKDTSGLTVTAGQRVGIKVKTPTDWAPAGIDVGAELVYEF